MRLGYALAAAAIQISVAAGVARADDAGVRKAIDAQYAVIHAAIKRKDVPGIMALYAKDYSGRTVGGKAVDRRQAEEAWKSYLATLQSIEITSGQIQKIIVKGDTAAVGLRFSASMVLIDRRGSFGKPGATHHIQQDGRESDSWAKEAGSWKLKSSWDPAIDSMTVDGKPFKSATAKRAPARAPSKG